MKKRTHLLENSHAYRQKSLMGLLALLFLLLFQCSEPAATYYKALKAYAGQVPEAEIRALWVVRDQITTRAGIHEVVQLMRRRQMNTAVVQVRGRGDAYYRSDFIPRAWGIEAGLDPLAEFIKQASPYGIKVHAWVNIFLVANQSQLARLPANHIIHNHPNWIIKDKNNRSMLKFSEKDWQGARIEGIFLDPALPEVRRYNQAMVSEILRRYKIDGLHMDYIRYPLSRAGSVYNFGPAKGRSTVHSNDMRRKHITSMVRSIRSTIDEKNPEVILTAAVYPSRRKITKHIFQDFPGWIKEGLIDYAFMMAYYRTRKIYDSHIRTFYDPDINDRFVIGIGIYQKPKPGLATHQVRSARAMGAGGVSYFRARSLLQMEADQSIEAYGLGNLFKTKRPAEFSRNSPGSFWGM